VTVVSQGDPGVLLDPPFEVPPPPTNLTVAPGGVQIGGDTIGVSLVENTITGGARNGITLGEIITLDANGGDTGQFNGSTTGGQNPCQGPSSSVTGPNYAVGGPITGLFIDRNIIMGQGMCGIGAVGFFDLNQTPEVVMLFNVGIAENLILGTLTQSLTPPDPTAVPAFGYGAICLPFVEGLTIRDNTITDFGDTPGADVCGIFIFWGQGIEISRNQICETRQGVTADTLSGDYAGMRAGVLITMATPLAFVGLNDSNQPQLMYQSGQPALRMHENVVRVAYGMALSVIAAGPVAVANNHLSTGGTIAAAAPVTTPAETGATATVATAPASTAVKVEAARANVQIRDTAVRGINPILLAPPSSPTPPTAKALTVGIVNIGLSIEVLSAQPSFIGQPASGQTSDAFLTLPASGAVQFSNNMCQFEGRTSTVVGICSVGIYSNDAIVFGGNQIWFDSLPAPPGSTVSGVNTTTFPYWGQITGRALYNTYLQAGTIQAVNNRFQEADAPAWPANQVVIYSAYTTAVINVTAFNIGTFHIAAYALPNYIIPSPNIILLPLLPFP
jgi:hypothetical protein